ncbi:hypothetical protein DICPUDRAFT_159551 [Dictyostelium purpureum]|uniref:Aminotransferase class I/classII large domain-containing protein n=1 Tax=Dictyostelium purpureum TaxID=5786 RepID=F1A4E5_DICPU|nr:uncharacterized protein DICPUDRAFT_159551 [Dictyostelium purpureum]EGC28937.1 hypothetical protein DICPUDRAFT_159551 [Dictyostelium purpureum]|eukprot:XP_003294538.1 hypothetical protein DICPUDRAFT_159551 [Dictyostelium purpureum]
MISPNTKSTSPIQTNINDLNINEEKNKELKYYEKGEIISNPITNYQPFFSVRNISFGFQESVRLKAFLSQKDVISLGAGEPSPEFFPLNEIKLNVKNFEKEIVINGEELHYIQSYSIVPGYYKLVKWLTNLQRETHGLQNENTPGREWNVVLTHGAQGALDCIFKALFDRNDSILTENFTYGGVFGFCAPHGVNFEGIDMDERGIIPKNLEKVLKNWKEFHKGLNFPKALYIIPNAQNPTAAQYDIQRKIEIYNICSKYNLLIIEDDPHIFLQLDGKKDINGRFIGEESFLSMDIDKRVIRIDTFSKFLTSGVRLGFLTTWNLLYRQISAEVGNSIYHTSNLAQIVIWKILESWGIQGFYSYVKRNQQLMIKKRDFMKSMFEKYLNGLVEYNNPKGGLYFWVKLLGVECSNTFVTEYLYPNKLLLCMGVNFSSIRNHKTPYVRFTFSFVPDEEVEKCFVIIKDALLKIKDK